MRDSHAPFGEKERSQGSAIVLFEITVVVSYRPSIVTTALSLTVRSKFAIECRRYSHHQGMGQFKEKFGAEMVIRCKPNFNAIWERHGAVVGLYAKEILLISSAV